jgi:hypothetical protein
MKPLTAKQEKFCQNIAIHHMTQHDAYINAYDTSNCSDVTIDVNARGLYVDYRGLYFIPLTTFRMP